MYLGIDFQFAGVDQALVDAGFVCEYRSDSGSRYYRRGTNQVRVSNHYVPTTGERECGGQSWCGTRAPGPQIILPVADVAAAVANAIEEFEYE